MGLVRVVLLSPAVGQCVWCIDAALSSLELNGLSNNCLRTVLPSGQCLVENVEDTRLITNAVTRAWTLLVTSHQF